jgi:hypothetical protein
MDFVGQPNLFEEHRAFLVVWRWSAMETDHRPSSIVCSAESGTNGTAGKVYSGAVATNKAAVMMRRFCSHPWIIL